MPIVIDEVLISINVNNSVGGSQNSSLGNMSNAKAKQQLVEECVEQVMQMLSEKEEP
ncbi:MAG: hypothetical protein ACJAVV_002924 [Alphaproteobacteria bacterium]|jgi:hypothetical protein